MPKGHVQSGDVLFSRESLDDDSTADDWDDTELLKEYDRAVRPLKALVAERMGLTNAEVEEASATESCGSSRSVIDKKGAKTHRKNQKKKNKKKKNKQQREWAVGDHCQAMFTADNQWYEATIISIDHEHHTCNVQYVGYGNKEEIPLSTIGQSMGAAVRREQGRIANLEKDCDPGVNESDDHMERSSQASSSISQCKGPPSFPRNKFSGTSSSNFARGPPPMFAGPSCNGMPGSSGLPPQTLMNDMFAPPLPPHVISGLPVDDSEALSAMLMSWYMSGFHTGYYQGLKRSRNTS